MQDITINFQFPNGFSPERVDVEEPFVTIFQFPNGFSLRGENGWQTEGLKVFQFPNGFSRPCPCHQPPIGNPDNFQFPNGFSHRDVVGISHEDLAHEVLSIP